jgi:hypothetical protein
VSGQFACGQTIDLVYNARAYHYTVNYAGGASGKDVVLAPIVGTIVTVR